MKYNLHICTMYIYQHKSNYLNAVCSIVWIRKWNANRVLHIQILHINCVRVKSRFSLNLLSIKRVFAPVIMYHVHQVVYMRLTTIHCSGYIAMFTHVFMSEANQIELKTTKISLMRMQIGLVYPNWSSLNEFPTKSMQLPTKRMPKRGKRVCVYR